MLADEEMLADAVMPPLPRPANREQALYHEVLQRIFSAQERRYRRLHQERQKQGEFLATWVHDTKMPIAVSRLLLEGAADTAPEQLLSSLEEEPDRIEAGVELGALFSETGIIRQGLFDSGSVAGAGAQRSREASFANLHC